MKESGIITTNGAEKVNFREIRMGNIAPNTLYRSSHPIKDNQQEKIISMLASQARIQTIINLSDTDSEIKFFFSCCFVCFVVNSYFSLLVKNNKKLHNIRIK
jgi:hypothetical protein